MGTNVPVNGVGPVETIAASVIKPAGYIWSNNNPDDKDRNNA